MIYLLDSDRMLYRESDDGKIEAQQMSGEWKATDEPRKSIHKSCRVITEEDARQFDLSVSDDEARKEAMDKALAPLRARIRKGCDGKCAKKDKCSKCKDKAKARP